MFAAVPAGTVERAERNGRASPRRWPRSGHGRRPVSSAPGPSMGCPITPGVIEYSRPLFLRPEGGDKEVEVELPCRGCDERGDRIWAGAVPPVAGRDGRSSPEASSAPARNLRRCGFAIFEHAGTDVSGPSVRPGHPCLSLHRPRAFNRCAHGPGGIGTVMTGRRPTPGIPEAADETVRPDWMCLNGSWEFEVDPADSGHERGLHQRSLKDSIIVPFELRAPLSGFNADDFLPVCPVPPHGGDPGYWQDRHVLLHLQAVDYEYNRVGQRGGGRPPRWREHTDHLQPFRGGEPWRTNHGPGAGP